MATATIRIYQPEVKTSAATPVTLPYLHFQKATSVEVREDILTFKTQKGKVVHTNLPFLCMED